jgi:thioesterase-3
MVHAIEIKVRGYHLDIFGHVNNARYLEFLEEARWSIIEERIQLDSLFGKGYLFVVVNININYRRPAFLNQIIRIETLLKSMKTHSGILNQVVKLKDNDTVVADAEVTFVILDSKTQKPLKIEGELEQLLLLTR